MTCTAGTSHRNDDVPTTATHNPKNRAMCRDSPNVELQTEANTLSRAVHSWALIFGSRKKYPPSLARPPTNLPAVWWGARKNDKECVFFSGPRGGERT